MEPHAILDFAIFQLTPTRTRCELYVVAGNETEKLASGLFKPFSSHLQSVEEQLAKGAYSICLQPPCNGSDISWFTKGTVERFVSFVSNPEVLERVNSTEMELQQLEETVRMQTRNLSEVNDAPTIFPSGTPPGGQDMSSVRMEKDVHLIQMKQDPLNEIETLVKENSRKRLLNALDARRMFLQKEQGMCFARAAAAGFDSRQLMELIMFSSYFKATRLREACTKFMDLYKKRQESGLLMQDMESLASFCSRKPFANRKKCKEELKTKSDAACDHTERGKHHESILNDKANIDASEDLFVINGRRWQTVHDLEDFHGGTVQNTRTDQCVLGMIDPAIENEKFDQNLENHGDKEILPVQCASVEANAVVNSVPFRRWRKASPLRNGQISPGCPGQLSELVENSINEPLVFPGSSSKDEKEHVEPARLRVRDVIGMFEQKCHQVHSGEVGLCARQDRVNSLTHTKPRKKVLEKWSVIRDESDQKMNEENAELDLKNEAEFTKEVIVLGGEQKDDLKKSANRIKYDGAESVSPCPQMGLHGLDSIMVSNSMDECPQVSANLMELYGDHGVEERVLELSNELRLPYLSDLHGEKPGKQLTFTDYFCSYSEQKTRQDLDEQLLSQQWPAKCAGGNDILCNKLSQHEVRSSIDSSVVASQPLPASNCSISERVSPDVEEKAEYKEKLAVTMKVLKQKRVDHYSSPSLEMVSTKFESSDFEAPVCTAFSKVSTSNDRLTAPKQAEERVKRFLNQYHEKREAKRKDISRSKMAGKLVKSKDEKEVLKKKKEELGKSHKVERSNLLAEAHMRAEKLRAYKADLQRSRKEKEEEERRRLEELKERRRERAAARRSASPLSTPSTLSSPQWHRATLLPPGPSPPTKWSPRSQKATFSGKSTTHDELLSKPLCRKSNEVDGSHPCRVNRRSENLLSKSASSANENVKTAGRNPSLRGHNECKNGLQSKSPNQLVSPPYSKKNSTSTSNITAKRTVSLSQTSASKKVVPPLDVAEGQGLSGRRGGNNLPVSRSEPKHVGVSKKDIKQSIKKGKGVENGVEKVNNSNSYKSSTHLNLTGTVETRSPKNSQAVLKNATSNQLGDMESVINGELSSDGGHSRLEVHDFSFHKEGRDFEEAQPARGVQECPLTGEFHFQNIENFQQPVGFVFPSFVKGQHIGNYPSANMECEAPNSGVSTLENMYFSTSPPKPLSSVPFEDNYKYGVLSSPAGESVLSELSALRTPCATRSPSFAVSFDVSAGVSDAHMSPLYHDQSPRSAPLSTSQNVYINVSGGSGELNIPTRGFQEPRAKWGNSGYVSFLDMNSPSNNQGKDLKRILKFGRKATTKQHFTDQVSASTTSEGDEDWGNLSEPGANIVDCYGRKKHLNGKIFNLRASTNDIHYYSASLSGSDGTRVPLKRSVSAQEVNSKSQDQNNLKTSAGKTSRSFFSLARFRRKLAEGRSR